MLMMHRKVGETVEIGPNITVTVMSIDKFGQALLGIEAPRDLEVDRREYRMKKKAESFERNLLNKRGKR